MPTYQYRCRDCNEELEIVQAFTDDALTVCPNCGGSLRKVFGKVGIAFKGSGFYKNDSRSDSGGGKADAASKGTSSESSASSSGASGDGGSSTTSSTSSVTSTPS